MGIKVNFSDLPENASENIIPGIYILEVVEVIEDTNENNDSKMVMAHQIVGTQTRVNYDNYVLFSADGTKKPFGLQKLRNIINATGIEIEEISQPALNALMKGKRFKANLVLNDRGYPNINFKDIYPLSYEKVALNEELAKGTVVADKSAKKTEASLKEVAQNLLNADDI